LAATDKIKTMKNDDTTKSFYEKHADLYLERNVEESMLKIRHNMLSKYLADLPKDSKIFEVGSAGGDDAEFLVESGFTNVTPSDYADSFIEIMRAKGLNPVKFDIVNDEFAEKYDFIYCWAVLMHLSKEQSKNAIRKIYEALNDNGRIITCVKISDEKNSEELDFENIENTKRFFSYWKKEEFLEYLNEVSFSKIETWEYGNWLDCYLVK
jgi:2-polyprenyl-3-methyl-5-hydroxy-6-metoxy-1,4-benzoquinol methylase